MSKDKQRSEKVAPKSQKVAKNKRKERRAARAAKGGGQALS
jgi:hypothetical protein